MHKLYDDNKVDCSSDWSKKYRDFSTDAWNQLQSIYSKPSDIDLFTGGLAQGPHNGGLTGKVFNLMKGKYSTFLVQIMKAFFLPQVLKSAPHFQCYHSISG